MAGDWIKMRVDLVRDPAVKGMARALGINRFEVVGRLHSVWSWADQHLHENGNAPGVTESDLDDEAGMPGFAKAMAEQHWLKLLSTGISFPNFERHNGKPAKDRALTHKRVKRLRNDDSVTKALPEKRRSNTNGVDVMRLAGEPKPETKLEPRRGESAEEFERRKIHGEPPQMIPQTAAQSLARANQALAEIRNAPAEPMSAAAQAAVAQLRKASRLANLSSEPAQDPDDIPYERTEPEHAQAGANQ